MNLQNLPAEIVQPVAKQGGEEIENLRYSNRYFYELFSDSYMKKEIILPTQMPSGIRVWDTKMFFARCFRNRKFGHIVSFFNEVNPFSHKFGILYLCIHFMPKEVLEELLSRIKFKFIDYDRMYIIINKDIDSSIEEEMGFSRHKNVELIKERGKKSIDTLNYIKQKYSHLFCRRVHISYESSIKIIRLNNIDDLDQSLAKHLIDNMEKIKFQEELTEPYKKILNFLTEDQIKIANESKMNKECLLTMFLINGNSLIQTFSKQDIKIIRPDMSEIDETYRFIILNHCSFEAIKELIDNNLFLTEENLLHYNDFAIFTFCNQKFALIAERMASFLDDEDEDLDFYLLFLFGNTISYLFKRYSDFDEFLLRIEDLTCYISIEIFEEVLFTYIQLYSTSYISEFKYAFYVIVPYLKKISNIEKQSEEVSLIFEDLIIKLIDIELYDLVKYLYVTFDLNSKILSSYPFDKENNMSKEKLVKIIPIVRYIVERKQYNTEREKKYNNMLSNCFLYNLELSLRKHRI